MTDDLDDELRRLFSDDRLDVHAPQDATDAVVRGADRRRRRRTAASSVFAIVALVGAGLGVSMLRLPQNDDSAMLPTASPTASSSTPSPAPSPSTSTVTVTTDLPPSNPTGGTNKPDVPDPSTPSKPRTTTPPPTPEIQAGQLGALKLGMSEADALNTGVLIEPGGPADPENRCKAYSTRDVPDADAVIFSPTKGLVRITYQAIGKTPKNIGAGSTLDAVRAAYPSVTQSGDDLVVSMTATPKWFLVLENDGATVTTMRMRLAANDCATA